MPTPHSCPPAPAPTTLRQRGAWRSGPERDTTKLVEFGRIRFGFLPLDFHEFDLRLKNLASPLHFRGPTPCQLHDKCLCPTRCHCLVQPHSPCSKSKTEAPGPLPPAEPLRERHPPRPQSSERTTRGCAGASHLEQRYQCATGPTFSTGLEFREVPPSQMRELKRLPKQTCGSGSETKTFMLTRPGPRKRSACMGPGCYSTGGQHRTSVGMSRHLWNAN